MQKVLCVFGTRPEAIKIAPVIEELKRHSDQIETVVCATAQHREMLDSVLEVFHLQPDYDLDIMQPDQSLAEVTTGVLRALDAVLSREKPDWVLVQGDTTTAMAAALAAYYRRMNIGHIEAGLRTGDKYQPFPEEINRKVVDSICDLHFAPTDNAKQNLLREGISASNIIVTGNTVVDALQKISRRPYDWAMSALATVPQDGQIILVTAHRRESLGEPLRNICEAIRSIAPNYPDIKFVFPVHLNPNVRQVVLSTLGNIPNLILTEPLDYVSLTHLLKRSYLVLTDSGGLQEEAPVFGIPVLVMRERTERPEAIWAGTAQLVGTQTGKIIDATVRLLTDRQSYQRMARATNPFGDGHASERIVKTLLRTIPKADAENSNDFLRQP